MPPMNYSFDATQHKPIQGGEGHPVGKFPFKISHTEIVPTKDQSGGMFVVEFTTPAGSIKNRYNLWNQSPKAVEIAHGQLSALCHAVGVFRLDMQNEGAALRNAQGQLEVGYQKGEEPTPDKPGGGYVEVKKVFDSAGNEPGKGPAPAPSPAQQSSGWNGNPAAQPALSGWQGQPQATHTTPQVAQQNPAWGQTGQAPPADRPPWATK